MPLFAVIWEGVRFLSRCFKPEDLPYAFFVLHFRGDAEGQTTFIRKATFCGAFIMLSVCRAVMRTKICADNLFVTLFSPFQWQMAYFFMSVHALRGGGTARSII